MQAPVIGKGSSLAAPDQLVHDLPTPQKLTDTRSRRSLALGKETVCPDGRHCKSWVTKHRHQVLCYLDVGKIMIYTFTFKSTNLKLDTKYHSFQYIQLINVAFCYFDFANSIVLSDFLADCGPCLDKATCRHVFAYRKNCPMTKCTRPVPPSPPTPAPAAHTTTKVLIGLGASVLGVVALTLGGIFAYLKLRGRDYQVRNHSTKLCCFAWIVSLLVSAFLCCVRARG